MAAPVALVDDDRPISGVSSSVSGRTAPPPPPPQKGRAAAAATEAAPRLLSGDGDGIELPDSGFSSWESRAFRSSVDRGKDFEEKLTVCFPSVTADTESLARGGAMSADSLPEEDELWKVLTSSYGHVMPVDWKLTSSLHVPTFHLEENPTDVTAEVSDEEELREQLDTHSIIVSSLSEEPFFTVEQVIEEIEEMMEDSPDTDAGPDLSQSDRSTLLLDVQRSTGSPGYESRVRTLSVAELSERLEDSETNIRMFSEELVQQLALRDELGFEKEVKNSFISALIDVQNRRKEQRELLKKKKKLKVGAGTSQSLAEKTPGSRFSMEGISSVIQNSFRHTFGSACRDRQYLTTVIPYEKKGHPPSLEDLQTLTTILQAMRDDSDKVPSLLTDYILKVLCPT